MVQNAKRIDSFLLSRLEGKPKNLYDAASYLLEHGGKRLRPYMVMKSCELLGGNVKQAMVAAAAIEMVHNFTLIHDDIMDNDEMRHGVPTVHIKFGVPVGILAGDLLFAKAFEIIAKSSSHTPKQIRLALISTLATACRDVCEGQALDINMAISKSIPYEREYIKMIEKKTSSLFMASCTMGAIVANTTQKDIRNLSIFGKNLGIAFQIIDDLIGVIGDPKITKKPVGNDIREGKKSLPILLAIRMADKQEKRTILNAFGNSSVSKSQMKKAVETIDSLEIEKTVRQQAACHSKTAKKSISAYNNSARKELVSLLDFVVDRSL